MAPPKKVPTFAHPSFTVDADGNGSQGEVILTLNANLKFEISLPAYLRDFLQNHPLELSYDSAAEAVAAYEALCNDYQSFALVAKATIPMLMLRFIPTRMATGFGVEMVKVKTTAEGKVFDSEWAPVKQVDFVRVALFPDTPENETMLTVLVGSVEKAADAIASVISSTDPEMALRSLLDLQSAPASVGVADLAPPGVSAEEKAAVLASPAKVDSYDPDEL